MQKYIKPKDTSIKTKKAVEQKMSNVNLAYPGVIYHKVPRWSHFIYF